MTALATVTVAACLWANPGANPYTGPVPAAVDAYADIPAAARARLRTRMERRQYDDVAVIRRDRISGRSEYTDLRAMHFGAGRVCETVDRRAWKPTHEERGLVYCEDGHCVIVPTVCRNVARVQRLGQLAPAAGQAAAPVAALPANEPTFAQSAAVTGAAVAPAGDGPLAPAPAQVLAGATAATSDGVPLPWVGYGTPWGQGLGAAGGGTVITPPDLPELPTLWLAGIGAVAVALARRWTARRERSAGSPTQR